MKTRILNSQRLGSGSSKMRLNDSPCCLCGVGRIMSVFHFPSSFYPLSLQPSRLHRQLPSISHSSSRNTCVIHIGMDFHFWQREAWSQFRSPPAMDEALLTWISPVSPCDGCLSHQPIPSVLTWYDGRWYRTTARWLWDVSGGLGVSETLTDATL